MTISRALFLVAACCALRAAHADSPSLWTDVPRGGRRAVPFTAMELADRARPAVVHVRGTLVDGPGHKGSGVMTLSVGSGFLIDQGGHVVTNEHVIRGVVDLHITLYDGRDFPGCVVGADETTDVALLKISPRGPLPVLPLADSDAVRVGEPVVAIGSPFGFKHSVTAGIVSAKERVIDRGNGTGESEPTTPVKPYSFFIQTDASINVGNSGGPLIDGAGAVIGINAAFWGGPQPSQGVSFAIPINIVKVLLPRLRAEGEALRSYLGVSSQPVSAVLAEGLKVPSVRGALVANVEAGSAAEAAGLEPGDVVITWDGRTVATDEDFKIYAQLTGPRRRIPVGVIRDGKTVERIVTTRVAADATPGPVHPSACRAQVPAAASGSAVLGMETNELAPARAKEMPGGRGIEVMRVTGGAAAEAGLVPGDILLRAGRTPLSTTAEFRRILRQTAPGFALPLLVRHEGEDYWTSLIKP